MCIRDRDIAIKKCETVFDKIRNKNIEKIPVLQKSGIYKLKCNDCNKVYLGETARKFVWRLSDHKRGEGNRTTNSLYATYLEVNHKFVNPLEDYEIVKVVNNTVESKLREELQILKEREKGLDNFINIKIKFDNEEIFYNIIKN